MSLKDWSIIYISDVSGINRIVNKNIYTILECDEEEEEPDECTSLVDGREEKNEKKFDVFKLMKDYVKKH